MKSKVPKFKFRGSDIQKMYIGFTTESITPDDSKKTWSSLVIKPCGLTIKHLIKPLKFDNIINISLLLMIHLDDWSNTILHHKLWQAISTNQSLRLFLNDRARISSLEVPVRIIKAIHLNSLS